MLTVSCIHPEAGGFPLLTRLGLSLLSIVRTDATPRRSRSISSPGEVLDNLRAVPPPQATRSAHVCYLWEGVLCHLVAQRFCDARDQESHIGICYVYHNP